MIRDSSWKGLKILTKVELIYTNVGCKITEITKISEELNLNTLDHILFTLKHQ